MKTITKEMVAQAVAEAIPELAFVLPRDIEEALVRAAETETSPRASEVLRILCENARIAARDRVPICQDTGSIWVCLEVGPDILVPGDVFADVNAAVAEGYIKHNLRKSIVRNALFDRANTGDNTPAFTELRTVDAPGARLQVMLKGGGSDNASRVVMLSPGAGAAGVRQVVLDAVREKAANACPPLIIGVGVGSTFDKVAGLAKHALLRPVGTPAKSAQHAAFEAELLEAVNATGIGPGALGGKNTALAVNLETAPCHIAALPVAVNLGCSAMRSASVKLEVRP